MATYYTISKIPTIKSKTPRRVPKAFAGAAIGAAMQIGQSIGEMMPDTTGGDIAKGIFNPIAGIGMLANLAQGIHPRRDAKEQEEKERIATIKTTTLGRMPGDIEEAERVRHGTNAVSLYPRGGKIGLDTEINNRANTSSQNIPSSYGGVSNGGYAPQNGIPISDNAQVVTNQQGGVSGTHETGQNVPIVGQGQTQAIAEPGEVVVNNPDNTATVMSKRNGMAQAYQQAEGELQQLIQLVDSTKDPIERNGLMRMITAATFKKQQIQQAQDLMAEEDAANGEQEMVDPNQVQQEVPVARSGFTIDGKIKSKSFQPNFSQDPRDPSTYINTNLSGPTITGTQQPKQVFGYTPPPANLATYPKARYNSIGEPIPMTVNEQYLETKKVEDAKYDLSRRKWDSSQKYDARIAAEKANNATIEASGLKPKIANQDPAVNPWVAQYQNANQVTPIGNPQVTQDIEASMASSPPLGTGSVIEQSINAAVTKGKSRGIGKKKSAIPIAPISSTNMPIITKSMQPIGNTTIDPKAGKFVSKTIAGTPTLKDDAQSTEIAGMPKSRKEQFNNALDIGSTIAQSALPIIANIKNSNIVRDMLKKSQEFQPTMAKMNRAPIKTDIGDQVAAIDNNYAASKRIGEGSADIGTSRAIAGEAGANRISNLNQVYGERNRLNLNAQERQAGMATQIGMQNAQIQTTTNAMKLDNQLGAMSTRINMNNQTVANIYEQIRQGNVKNLDLQKVEMILQTLNTNGVITRMDEDILRGMGINPGTIKVER